MIQFIMKGEFNQSPENFKELNGHYIAEYKENISEKERLELKNSYKKGSFRLAYWEKGGQKFDKGVTTGHAEIIGDLYGFPMVPVKIKTRGILANKEHALFIGREFSLAVAHLENKVITLTLKQVSIKPRVGILKENILWEGTLLDLKSLPEELECYKEMLEKAREKVLIDYCTKPIFYVKN